jgi:hypothetical protein
MDLSVNEELPSNDCLRVNLKVLRLVGLWQDFTPTKHFAWTAKLFSYYKWILLFLMIVHTISEIIDIVLTWGDLKNLAENGSLALIYTAAVFKQLNFLLRQKRIEDVVHNVNNNLFSKLHNWTLLQNKITQKVNRHAYIVSWTYYIFGITSASLFVLLAVSKSCGEYFGLGNIQAHTGNRTLRTLIFKAWFPFDIQQSRYYALAFAFQLLLGIVGPLINIGIDTFIVCLIVNCCGQFKILKYSVRTMRERAEELVTQEIISRENCESVKDVPEHKKNVRSKETGIITGDLCV